jgi:hypothetical protein
MCAREKEIREMAASFILLFTSVAVLVTNAESFAQDDPMQRAIAERLDTQIALMNKQMPIEIDAVTKLTAVSRVGTGVTYSYETSIRQSQWTRQLMEAASHRAVNGNCSGKNTRLLIDQGYTLRHIYFDQAGLFVTNILVTRDKCLQTRYGTSREMIVGTTKRCVRVLSAQARWQS